MNGPRHTAGRTGVLLVVMLMAITGGFVAAAPAGAVPPPKPPPSACPPGATPSYPPGACTLVLDKNAANRGETVTIVEGCGYLAGSRVILKLVPTAGGKTVTVGRLTADANGCINGQSFVVPNNAKIGTYTLLATGKDANGAAYELVAAFEITNAAAAAIKPSQVSNVRAAGDQAPLVLGVVALLLLALGSGVTSRTRRQVKTTKP